MTLLNVDRLHVGFDTEQGQVEVLNDVSFELKPGQTLGIVGESGCGKSVTALSIMRLLPQPSGKILSGSIQLQGQDLASIDANTMQTIRGNRIAMIFQDPMTALNPVYKVGRQMLEVFQLHFPDMPLAESRQQCIELLHRVGIPAPEQRLESYPHQLSGGMRQRVMIAMALACKPDILIADEPTTALDVTIQAQILALMQELQRDTGMAIIFITHDLGVIAELCDDVVVMYAGRVIETAPVQQLFHAARHPYTQGLLASIPRLEYSPKTRLNTIAGNVPSLAGITHACRFNNRCQYSEDNCQRRTPVREVVSDGHSVSCLRWREVIAQG